MFTQANNIKAGNTVQMGLGGEIIEVFVRTIKQVNGLLVINKSITVAADKSVYICNQLVDKAAYCRTSVQYVVKLACGMFWRGNTSAPVKTKACAAIMCRADALKLQAVSFGAMIMEAPRAR